MGYLDERRAGCGLKHDDHDEFLVRHQFYKKVESCGVGY